MELRSGTIYYPSDTVKMREEYRKMMDSVEVNIHNYYDYDCTIFMICLLCFWLIFIVDGLLNEYNSFLYNISFMAFVSFVCITPSLYLKLFN